MGWDSARTGNRDQWYDESVCVCVCGRENVCVIGKVLFSHPPLVNVWLPVREELLCPTEDQLGGFTGLISLVRERALSICTCT